MALGSPWHSQPCSTNSGTALQVPVPLPAPLPAATPIAKGMGQRCQADSQHQALTFYPSSASPPLGDAGLACFPRCHLGTTDKNYRALGYQQEAPIIATELAMMLNHTILPPPKVYIRNIKHSSRYLSLLPPINLTWTPDARSTRTLSCCKRVRSCDIPHSSLSPPSTVKPWQAAG